MFRITNNTYKNAPQMQGACYDINGCLSGYPRTTFTTASIASSTVNSRFILSAIHIWYNTTYLPTFAYRTSDRIQFREKPAPLHSEAAFAPYKAVMPVRLSDSAEPVLPVDQDIHTAAGLQNKKVLVLSCRQGMPPRSKRAATENMRTERSPRIHTPFSLQYWQGARQGRTILLSLIQLK